MAQVKALYTHKQAEASLNMLARIIANENLTITMNANAPTAYFDVQNRILVLPAWEALSKDLGEATRGHEVAHALWTPAKGWHAEVTKFANAAANGGVVGAGGRRIKFPKMYANCLNITEDARIEKKLKEHLPGFRAVMERAYVEMYDILLPQNNMTIDSMCAHSCMDRVNYVAKAGIKHIARLQTNEERLLYVKMLEAQTWEDAVECAEILYDMRLREKQDQKDDKQSAGQPQYSDGSDGIPDEVLDWDEMTDEQKAEAKRQMKEKQKNKPKQPKGEQKPKQEKGDKGEAAPKGEKENKAKKEQADTEQGSDAENDGGEQADGGEDQEGDAGQEGQGQERESNGELGSEGSDKSDQGQEGDGSEGEDDGDEGESQDKPSTEGKLADTKKDKRAGEAGAALSTRDQIEACADIQDDDQELFSLEKFAQAMGGGKAGGKAVMPRIVAKKQVKVRGLFE